MNSSAIPIDVQAEAPELARRLGMILAALAALVAARFLRRPGLAGLIIPLWRRLTHVARRFSAATRPTAARRKPTIDKGAAAKGTAVRLPGGRGWLVRELGYEAVGYGSQLAALLAEPAMQATLVAMPRVGRVLRPLCRMLGLSSLMVLEPGKPARDKPAPVRAPRQARSATRMPASVEGWQAVADGQRHSPVSHWVTRRARNPGRI